MQAYKTTGTIDRAGNLILAEPLNIPPGEVEIILLRSVTANPEPNGSAPEPSAEQPKLKRASKIKAFAGLFEKTEPAPPDFDADEARWEALKEKYDL
ncbi:hypothetical protein [Planktothricoides raciborskii]|uniref:Uncharacterized protein n=1 Tax=Planktothricoides raciborskii FACHB-1370 TaxID=2949576 RepID=A0ABR8EIB5_9CYAN|nr:hypothetical protein [Planktothricoides raciborskii]MBD2546609.1 hypothetical protein [Planktothricoides raciborskii FACHB-1370]MBD2585135.1 hypothetical protein [Planktothricoides raciborskii FACHB-1261]